MKTKSFYDYKNTDIDGLRNYIKNFDFNTAVFSHPTVQQTELYEKILVEAFNKYVPCKTVIIRHNDQPWANTYTRLLLRKKNRNYQIYKKINCDYTYLSNKGDISPEILTRYQVKKDKAQLKARNAANASNLANRRAKCEFFNTVNCIMNKKEI